MNSVKYAADAEITAVDGSGTATITFAVESGTSDDTPCTIVYPLAAAKEDHSAEKSYDEFLSTQDGTLNANLDVRVGSGMIQVTTPGLNVTTQPAPLYAIIKIIFDGFSPYSLAVRNGSNALITSVSSSSAAPALYVAVPPTASGETFILTAYDISIKYTKSISSTSDIVSGYYYVTTLNSWQTTSYTLVNLVEAGTDPIVINDASFVIGPLNKNVKVSIADGATVTLEGVTINGTDNVDYLWAGLTCLGDATIFLSGTNSVRGFDNGYPGIEAGPSGKTLTILGNGSLNASSNGYGEGIGGHSCGNITITGGSITASGGTYSAGIGAGTCGKITISGGTVMAYGGQFGAGIGCSKDGKCTDGIEICGTAHVTAQGGEKAAGIGSGHGNNGHSNCGDIIISGTATVIATGGQYGAGIGSGKGIENNNWMSNCGNITISNTVTSVTATRGIDATNSIGKGDATYSTCGTVTIGGVVGAISASPYTYPAP